MPVPANVANSRMSPPTRVVTSSASSSSVDELPSGANVAFDSAEFGYYEEPSSFDRRGEGDRQQNFSHQPGNLNAPSQAFVSMLESSGGTDTGNSSGVGETGAAILPGMRSKVIEAYETNAKIIGGEINILGTSVSLEL